MLHSWSEIFFSEKKLPKTNKQNNFMTLQHLFAVKMRINTQNITVSRLVRLPEHSDHNAFTFRCFVFMNRNKKGFCPAEAYFIVALVHGLRISFFQQNGQNMTQKTVYCMIVPLERKKYQNNIKEHYFLQNLIFPLLPRCYAAVFLKAILKYT